MIIQRAIIPDPTTGQTIEKLVVDGKPDMESNIEGNSWEIKSSNTFYSLLNHSCDDPLFNNCYSFYFYEPSPPLYDFPLTWSVSHINDESNSEHVDCTIRLEISIDLTQWNRPYSFNAFKACYENRCSHFPNISYLNDSSFVDGDFIQLACTVDDRMRPLAHYLSHLTNCLQQLKSAEQILLHQSSDTEPDHLTATFHFPPEIRSACNQYLMYFGQFLEDLGILADTSLKEQVNNVLFTITPRDRAQALDVIYEALNIFLHAADTEIADEMGGQDFAHYEWKMNMYHLKSRLELAKALLQAKDATIDALKIANYQIHQTPPVPAIPAAEKEDEDILGGTVSITKIKAKGFTINLPKIIRNLRRKK